MRSADDSELTRILGPLHVNERTEAADTFRALLDAAPDGMVVVDAAGRIALVNRQTEALFGYPRDELLGQPVEVLVPDRHRDTHARHRWNFDRNPHTRPMGAGLELYARRKDGSEFPTEISLSPLHLTGGERLVIAAIRDVTDRKRTEEELRRSNAELEQFAYVASHDLQEPLRMVASYTQLLERRYKGKLDEDADEFIRFAVDGATRMQALINDLLAFSRVGTRGGEHVPTDCNTLVDRAMGDLAPAILESGGTVDRGNLPTVLADASQLQQLFQNLLGNALKFRAQGRPPAVAVGAERRGNGWLFWVRDNGIGIEPRYAERIFAVFQRLHTQAEYPGTGIGLAICRKIVERHGGNIWVESRPGVETTFFFTLPLMAREGPA